MLSWSSWYKTTHQQKLDMHFLGHGKSGHKAHKKKKILIAEQKQY